MAFSSACGLISLGLSKPISLWMGHSDPMELLSLGLGLLVFGGFLLYVTFSRIRQKVWTYIVCFMDFLWVLGSILLLLFKPIDLSGNGWLLVSLIAAVVGLLGIQQYRFNGQWIR